MPCNVHVKLLRYIHNLGDQPRCVCMQDQVGSQRIVDYGTTVRTSTDTTTVVALRKHSTRYYYSTVLMYNVQVD